LINKFTPASINTVTSKPLILCFKLLGVSLGNVNNAPIAMVNPTSKFPKYENKNAGITAESATLNALYKLVPIV
jgi:hypothetical protein